MPALRICHVITRLIVGGAQENTVLSCALADRTRFDTSLVVGPQTGAEGELFGEADARGIRTTVLPNLVREVAPVRDAAAVRDLVRLFRRERPDVVHTHSSKAGILGRQAARLARVPAVVHTVHGWSFHDHMAAPVRLAWIALERRAARQTDRMVVVTDRDREKGLAVRIGRPEQYLTIRSGFELGPFLHAAGGPEVRAELAIPEGAPVLGSVMRLSEQKDPMTLVRAAGVLLSRRPDAHVVVVGDGPLRGEVEQEVVRLGVGDRFHLVGLRRDVPRYLAAFDVFALTSLWEGLPRVVMQAMAARVPVVAVASDGVAEVVEDGRTGIVVAAGRPESLAEAVGGLMTDRERADRLASAALVQVDAFDAARMVAQLEDLYEAVAR